VRLCQAFGKFQLTKIAQGISTYDHMLLGRSASSHCLGFPWILTDPVLRGICGNCERDGAVDDVVVVDAEAGVEGWVESEPELELELELPAEDMSAAFEVEVSICYRCRWYFDERSCCVLDTYLHVPWRCRSESVLRAPARLGLTALALLYSAQMHPYLLCDWLSPHPTA
jgi:hypothetical protein